MVNLDFWPHGIRNNHWHKALRMSMGDWRGQKHPDCSWHLSWVRGSVNCIERRKPTKHQCPFFLPPDCQCDRSSLFSLAAMTPYRCWLYSKLEAKVPPSYVAFVEHFVAATRYAAKTLTDPWEVFLRIGKKSNIKEIGCWWKAAFGFLDGSIQVHS